MDDKTPKSPEKKLSNTSNTSELSHRDSMTTGSPTKPVARVNTYLPQELFKIVLISSSKERAVEEAGWITGTTSQVRGIYMCNHLKTKLAVFCRWPGMAEKQTSTVAVEALVIFVKDLSEWELVKNEAVKYVTIPIRVIVCDKKDEISSASKDLNNAIIMAKPKENKNLRVDLDKLDRDEYKRIVTKFNEFDSDKSGSIESHEMSKVAESLGIDPNDLDFVESLKALDLNGDGEISLPEFITWWKVGRQNTKSLPKIYHLNEYVKFLLNNVFNYERFKKEIADIKESNDTSRTNQNIYIKSPGEYSLKTFIEGSIAFGGPKRQQEAENFLKRFTTNLNSQKLNWISILFTLDNKRHKISGEQAKAHVENFKDYCLQWLENRSMGQIVSFLRNLLIFETSCTDNSVIMAIRLKADIEELVKTAMSCISTIVDCLSSKTESTFMSVKAHSNEDIFNSSTEKRTLEDFLKVSEFRVKSFGFRKRLKSLFANIMSDKIDLTGLLQCLFVPYSFDLNLTGDINDITDSSQKEFLKIDISLIGSFLEFLKQNMSSELLKSSKDIDIAFNAYDLFAHVKFYSEKMFST